MLLDEYKCWKCGTVVSKQEEPLNRVFCKACFEQHKADYKEKVDMYAKLKIEIMHETALRIMEKANMFMYEYQNAANEVLLLARENTESYYSSDEMIVAIVLTEYGFEHIPNYAIGKYRTDFYIPELCVCVEVDGHLHNGKEVYDNNRDIDIRLTLGTKWEIVHIKTAYIRKGPSKIPEAIEALAKEKRNIRRGNNGIIPEWYSSREKRHYNEIGEHHTSKARK